MSRSRCDSGWRLGRTVDALRARPVWTGPGAAGEQRLTAAVLHELLASARERILLVSYAAYTLPEVAADLEAAVDRGCQVDVVFETTADSAGAYTGPRPPVRERLGDRSLALASGAARSGRRPPRQAARD